MRSEGRQSCSDEGSSAGTRCAPSLGIPGLDDKGTVEFGAVEVIEVSVAGIALSAALEVQHCFIIEWKSSVHRSVDIAFHLLPKSMKSLNIQLAEVLG